MAEKRPQRSSIPPPPHPTSPYIYFNGTALDSVTAAGLPLTNGVHALEDVDRVSTLTPKTPGKPKTPVKPSKLTRAFSSGSIGFGKIGKSRKNSKVKNVARTTQSPNTNEVAPSPAAGNENENEQNGTEKDALWKLPGIGTIPKLKSPKALKASSLSDSCILERELPPVPGDSEVSDPLNRELLENRKLPPIPNSDLEPAKQDTPLPSSPVPHQEKILVSAGENAIESSELASAGTKIPLVNGHGVFTAREGDLDTNGVLSSSPPGEATPIEATPTPVDADLDSSGRMEFRPLPLTPPLDDEMSVETQSLDDLNAALSEPASAEVMMADTTTTTDKKEEDKVFEEPGSPVKNDSSGTSLMTSSLSSESFPTTEDPDPRGEEDEGELRDYTIGEIISTFSYALPARVKIVQGYCSCNDTTEVNISTDDVYNIHSVQHIKKVTVKDEDGMTHRLSLDAPVKIGLVYNPENDDHVSLSGYNFKNVSEVTSMPVLPKLISATQAVNYGEDKNSVSEGEIFVVKQIQRSLFKGKKGLKVYSLATGSNKVLLDDCQGQFTTKPSLVRMDLPEFLEKVDSKFPLRAVLYPTTDDISSKSDFPGECWG